MKRYHEGWHSRSVLQRTMHCHMSERPCGKLPWQTVLVWSHDLQDFLPWLPGSLFKLPSDAFARMINICGPNIGGGSCHTQSLCSALCMQVLQLFCIKPMRPWIAKRAVGPFEFYCRHQVILICVRTFRIVVIARHQKIGKEQLPGKVPAKMGSNIICKGHYGQLSGAIGKTCFAFCPNPSARFLV